MDISQKRLLDLITSEVMNYLETNHIYSSSCKKSVLVLGDIKKISQLYDDKYEYCDIESYKCDGEIEKYHYIYINKITNSQLCDIVLGRDDTAYTCAIQQALLIGKKIYMSESALKFRNYKKTASKELYNLLEQYIKKLVEFGIEVTNEINIEKDNTNYYDDDNDDKKEQFDSLEKLITYSVAQDLCKTDKKQVTFPKGTIITPLAKDLFITTKKTIKII